MKRLVTLALAGFLVFGVGALLPAAVGAETAKDYVCEGVGYTGASCPDTNAEGSVQRIVGTVINILSVIVGVVAVIMIIIGGFKYITSSGDSNNVSSAKNTILYAIVGLVIVALAQVIVIFVLNRADPPTDDGSGIIRLT